MSRSYKKDILKDKDRFSQKLGNRLFRRKSKSKLKLLDEDKLPHSKSEVVNDYNVSDYKFINVFKWIKRRKCKTTKKLFK